SQQGPASLRPRPPVRRRVHGRRAGRLPSPGGSAWLLLWRNRRHAGSRFPAAVRRRAEQAVQDHHLPASTPGFRAGRWSQLSNCMRRTGRRAEPLYDLRGGAGMSEAQADGSEEFPERMLRTMNEAALALMVSVGHRTGLFDVMAAMPAAT